MLAIRVRWASRGINDATAYKLERLYFGDPALLNVKGYYARTDWNDIRRALGFKTQQMMLDAITRTGDFQMVDDKGFVSSWLLRNGADEKGLMADLFSEANDLSTAAEFGRDCAQNEASGRDCAQLTDTSHDDSAQKEGEASREARAAEYIPAKGNNRGCKGEEEGSFDEDEMNEGVGEKGAQFFHWLNGAENPNGRPLFDLLKQQIRALDPSLNETSVREVLIALVQQHLIPYMDNRRKMLLRNRRGRLAWLRNLIVCPLGHKLCCDALATVRNRHDDERTALDQRRHACHPFSPYEYMDEQSGTRLYDDAVTGETLRLPSGAPPRPSATARWHPLRPQWKES